MENSEAVQLKSSTDQEIKHRFHVLAVDDSHIDRKLLERLLTVSSYQVTCVESGDKALEYLGLLGIQENEYETTSLSGAASNPVSQPEDSSWKDIPVVVMSSENVPSRINKCMEGGAEEFLLKPLTLSDLSKLHSHLLNSITHHDHPRDKNEQDEDENEEDVVVNKNKRKLATSSEPTERRPRVKELHVS
ncbi:two-component response regulator ORR5-like isoform X2 [Henckelia pumila]|uniref:two-component response regulator ORR5-like isoform X2 n=1 Tax=Henckelia pumila TaxID=405737 RepID=UPI003C6DBC39